MFEGGVTMMLKSMGIDAESISKTAGEMAQKVANIETSLVRIEGKLDLIISALPAENTGNAPVKLKDVSNG